MRILNPGTAQTCEMPRETVLCLGNFDGVHLGHRALIRAAREMRDRDFPRAALGVFCFEGLSSDWLSPNPPGHLTSGEERLERFAGAGAELAVIADFPLLRDTEPQEFVRRILIGDCRCVAAACGFNHRFGRRGEGTPDLLREMLGGRLLVQAAVMAGGEPISSTRIRRLLTDGKPDEAAALMGSPYRLTAPVISGAQLGRTIGFPTVNQRFAPLALIPRAGVYQTDCEVSGRHYAGVTDIGTRPTVNGAHEVRCETHLLDFDGDLYGKTVRVAFLRYLREERKFDTVEALREQIARDRETIQRLLARFMTTPSKAEAECFGNLPFSDDVLEGGEQPLAAPLTEKELAENHLFHKLFALSGKTKKPVRESAWYEGSVVRCGKHIRYHLWQYTLYKWMRYSKKQMQTRRGKRRDRKHD